MKGNELFTNDSKIWQDENDIIHVEYLKESQVNLDEVKWEMEFISKLSVRKKALVIIHMGKTKGITKDARDYLAQMQHYEKLEAVALITKSQVHKVMGNFFLGLNRPAMYVKLFTSENEASGWLEQFK